jgi:hypothetical protein
MPQDHRLQQQRFELKYRITEGLVPPIRDFVRSYLELDDYGAGRPDLAYPVHSLYLDSDDLKTHHASVNGDRNRFKLRLRYYDDQPDTPVFFEVKARADNCILKQRCGVRRQAVPLLVAGQLPELDDLASKEPRHLVTLQRFCLLLHQINAKPKAHNCYLREAWVSPQGNAVRITFDRCISLEPFFRAEPIVAMTQPVRPLQGFVVLELKFTARFPDWFRTMVQQFDLMQSSFSKYSGGVALLGEHRFRNSGRFDEWRHLAAARPAGSKAAPPTPATIKH